MSAGPEGRLLWKPTEAGAAATHVERYRRGLRALGIETADYADLWRWSVREPEAFWSSLLDHFAIEVRGDRSRVLSSRLEQTICGLLSDAGLTHSHSPRHFEVPVTDDSVGAYAPLIVLRGRGRGGKTVVIECAEDVDDAILHKIVAFRKRFGAEFYIIFVAPEEIVDLIPLAAYDESSVTTDLGTLINRLAD